MPFIKRVKLFCGGQRASHPPKAEPFHLGTGLGGASVPSFVGQAPSKRPTPAHRHVLSGKEGLACRPAFQNVSPRAASSGDKLY